MFGGSNASERRLKEGMVFNLSVGLQDVPLSEEERKGSGAASMDKFSTLIAGERSVCPILSPCVCLS